MNKKTLAKWFSAFAITLAAGVGTANAQSLKIDDFSINPDASKTVALRLASAGNTIAALQADIKAPQGFTFGDVTLPVDTIMLDADGKAVKATVSTQLRNDSTLRVAIYAEDFLDGKPYSFKISTDTLALVDIVAPADFTEDTALTLGNIHFSILDKEGKLSDKAVADATTKVLTFFVPDGKYLLKNIESGKYWGVGNSWGTQASLVKNAEFVTIIGNGDGTYKLESQVNNGGKAYYFEGDFMDNASPKALSIKKFGTDDEPYYTISSDAGYYGYDGETTVLGKGLKVEDAAAQWEIISIEGADSAAYLATAKADAPVDATWLIKDANFGRNNRYGSSKNADLGLAWTVSEDCTNKNLEGGDNTNMCAESYHSTFTISQKIKAPKGVYKLTAQGFYRQDGEDTENLPKFFIGKQEVTFPVKTGTENSMANASASFSKGLYTIEPIIFEQAEAGEIELGVKLAENKNLWVIWDNFTLEYYGNASLAEVLLGDKVQQVADLVDEALDLLANDFLTDEEAADEKEGLQEAVKNSRDLPATEKAYDAAIAELTEAIEAAKAVIAANVDGVKAAKKAEFDELAPVGEGLFQYSQEAIDAAKAAVDAATTAEEVEAVAAPALTAPVEGTPYRFSLETSDGTFYLTTDGGIKIADKAQFIYFVAQEDGTYALSNGTEYVNYEGSNNWTMTASEEAYGWTIAATEDGYTIQGKNGLLGTNSSDGNAAGSPLYGDKKPENGNVYWNILMPVTVLEEEAVLDNWTREFTGAGTDGSFVLNTWSVEADASGVKTPFIETWVWGGAGAQLSAEKISHVTIEDLEPGAYEVQLHLRAYNEMAGSSAPSGIKITANEGSVDISEGQEFTYNDMAGIWDYFTVPCTVGDNGKLDIAVDIYEPNVSWVAFKDLKVVFLGESDGTEVAISSVENANNATVGTQKVLRNGRIVIIKNGREYNVSGALLK